MQQALHRRFFRLTVLNILANITVPIAGLVDTGMLGHLPDIRFFAGVALASILFDYVYWTFGFLRMSVTGTTAQEIGRGNRQESYLVLYRSLATALALAAGVLLLHVPLREVGLAILSGEPGVEAAGREYFNARIWGAPATLCSFVFLGWYLGREESRYALWMTLAANLSNIGLNYVFIIRLKLAAFGAGLATMFAQYIMLAVALAIFFRLRGHVAWSWRRVLDRDRLKRLFRLNRDILLRTLCLVSAFAVFTNFSSILGTTLLAANTILLRLLVLAAYLIDGAAFASESLAGIFKGQGDRVALRRLFRLSLLSGEGFALIILVAFFLQPRLVYRLLTSHGDVIQTAATYGPWLIPTLVFGALAYMYDGLFLGLTEGRTLRNTMLFSTVVVFLPISYAGLHLGNNHLLWAGMAAFMLARAATLGLASWRRGHFSLTGSDPRVE